MASIRLLASLGAGGVIYLTPIVFHQASFTATQVGQGLAAAALIGTAARLLSGLLLDRGLSCSWPVRAAAVLAFIADVILLQAQGFGGYLTGQLLIGLAAGLYFPAIELAVPLSCAGFKSSRGYALARSADSLGVASGALIGAIVTALGLIRAVYVVEAVAVVMMLLVLSWRPLPDGRAALLHLDKASDEPSSASTTIRDGWRWLPPLLPVLAISIVATGMIALRQSALPLDLVRGGLLRPAVSETGSGALIALQLALLVALQWPVGNWVAKRSLRFGLGMGLAGFVLGSVLLASSAFWSRGMVLISLAMVPLAFGEAAFLPSAAEAMVEETPLKHRGLSMALFSQCFAISATGAPLLAGALLDQQGHGVQLWLLMAVICLAVMPLLRVVRPRYTASLQATPLESDENFPRPRIASLR
ncbi:MFS transporter [Synechococcus sp. MIT S9507]|uniref:MFS transporter n=1 Tax=Synechococcus sp. MIT S9507 TaxID=3082544 RepID=UPI0039B46B85